MFALRITLSEDSIEFIKAELTRKLPDVKSSHRCEAVARGLDFKTYAAARSKAGGGGREEALVQVDRFAAYLRDRHFDVAPTFLYDAAAKVALRDIVLATPNLSIRGIGLGDRHRKDDGRWESLDDQKARFQKGRKELLSWGSKSFLTSLAFVQTITPIKTIRSGTSSYWVKHIAENFNCTYPEGEPLGPIYVANGMLIAAALHAGFRMKIYFDDFGNEEVNVSFNMSVPNLKDLDCIYRPTSAIAENRRYLEQLKKRNRTYRTISSPI